MYVENVYKASVASCYKEKGKKLSKWWRCKKKENLSKMVEMLEPNSVGSQHLEQLHQKFFVIAK